MFATDRTTLSISRVCNANLAERRATLYPRDFWALALALGLGLAVAGCAPKKTSMSSPASVDAPSGQDLSPGTEVLVQRNGQWLPGTVVATVGPGQTRVRYEGYGPEWDEVVGPERIQLAAASEAGLAPFRAGDTVIVESGGRWFLATIVEPISGSVFRVRYEGFAADALEDVDATRLSTVIDPATLAEGISTGTAVRLKAAGEKSPTGVVVAGAPGDKVLVRFSSGQGQGAGFVDQLLSRTDVELASAPAASASSSDPPASAGPKAAFKSGDSVWVDFRGAYHPATVESVTGSRVRVKFADGSEDEIPASKDRVIQEPGERDPGQAFRAADEVYVEWHGRYFPGVVKKKTGPGQYRVRYEGFGPSEDEVVVAKRLRPRE